MKIIEAAAMRVYLEELQQREANSFVVDKAATTREAQERAYVAGQLAGLLTEVMRWLDANAIELPDPDPGPDIDDPPVELEGPQPVLELLCRPLVRTGTHARARTCLRYLASQGRLKGSAADGVAYPQVQLINSNGIGWALDLEILKHHPWYSRARLEGEIFVEFDPKQGEPYRR